MFSLKGGKLVKNNNKQHPIVPNSELLIILDSELPSFKDEIKNKLESIAILTTSREINEGLLERLLKNISDTTPINDLVLNIFTNNSNHEPVSFEAVENIFKSVNLVNINIHPDDDIYIDKNFYKSKLPDPIPVYGLTSGPNILFIKAMEVCKKYNTTLLLETDCKLLPNWFEKSMHYVSMEYFLVSGSTYDGELIVKNQNMPDYIVRIHLNGVAFYKSGSPVFQCMMSLLDKYTRHMAINVDNTRGYDYIMTHMVLFYTINSKSLESQMFWKNFLRYMFKTSLIVNVSPLRDTHIREDNILDVHKQCVILHKKHSEPI
jgi:hypothetical protein